MTEQNAPIILYMTCAGEEEARDISSALLKKHLIACANIFPAHESLFHWDGKVQQAQETAVIMKSQRSLFKAIEDVVLEKHSYDCPCLVSWPLGEAHIPFYEWIAKETTG